MRGFVRGDIEGLLLNEGSCEGEMSEGSSRGVVRGR